MNRLDRLFDAADDMEFEVLERLCMKAGILWRCNCGWNVDEDQVQCDNCGRLNILSKEGS